MGDVFPAETPDEIKDHTHWYFTSACVNVVYTDLEPSEVQEFQTNDYSRYGKSLRHHVYEAEVEDVSHEVPVSGMFQDRLDRKECGVILVEGKSKGSVLRIRGKTNTGFDICTGRVLLGISPVEAMYRWLDLRGAGRELLGDGHLACKCSATLCDGMSEPYNNPDSDCNGESRDGRHVVFVHGYNINAQEARAWGAEMFKRLWQSGSTSLFTVADWVGDAGQFGDPDDGKSVSYYYAVPNAFAAAKPLKEAAESADFKGVPVIMAHSLGNMVASSAIVDWKMPYGKYYMLNAAVAIQAYEGRRDYLMVEGNWRPIRENYYASYWYRNFRKENGFENDFRSKLFWCYRFGKIDRAVNCYSPSDDIVHNIEANHLGVYSSQSAWTLQERMKGRIAMRVADRFESLYTRLTESDNPKFLGTEAGWGFNIARTGILGNILQPTTDINNVPFKELIKEPIFYPFQTLSSKMNSPVVFEYREDD